jgi:predicted nucleic acid-binding protein
VLSEAQLPARDAVHVAVREHAGLQTIMSFDKGFDAVAGIVRVCD